MAVLTITEYAQGRGHPMPVLPVAPEPALLTQAVTYTEATQSTAFTGTLIRMLPAANCFVLFGADPEALVTSEPLLANVVEWRTVVPGDKLSVYDGTS